MTTLPSLAAKLIQAADRIAEGDLGAAVNMLTREIDTIENNMIHLNNRQVELDLRDLANELEYTYSLENIKDAIDRLKEKRASIADLVGRIV